METTGDQSKARTQGSPSDGVGAGGGHYVGTGVREGLQGAVTLKVEDKVGMQGMKKGWGTLFQAEGLCLDEACGQEELGAFRALQ